MAIKARRRRGGRPRSTKARHPAGQVLRDTTLPPPEVVARRGAGLLKDHDAGDAFGVMFLRGMLPTNLPAVNGIPGPTPIELKIAGQQYADLVAAYERIIDAPRCAVPRSGGRGLAVEDVGHAASVRAKIEAVRASLRVLDHGCLVALARAIAAVTHEQIEDALRWGTAIVPALIILHERADDIRRAGRAGAERVKEAA